MNILKIVGHLIANDNFSEPAEQLSQLQDCFAQNGFACSPIEGSLRVKNPDLILLIEVSNQELCTVEGEGVLTPASNGALRNALAQLNLSFQLDFFEEDGRMIKRLQS